MATFTSTATTVTVSGTYKEFFVDSGSTNTVIQINTGASLPQASDAGRFLLWQKGTDTGNWQVRYIESATSSAVTVGDGGFTGAPTSGDLMVISTNLQDIDANFGNSVVRNNNKSYQFINRDFSLANGAFLADTDKQISAKATSPSSFAGTFSLANNCVLQFGRLIGGEANDSTETIDGCALNLELDNNNSLIFTRSGSAKAQGPVVNLYGCQVTSTSDFNMFIRSSGPMRVIGCIFDGPMGGRLYSPASELVDTRFSGNEDGGIAWSLGGTFIRPISNALFFQNNTAVKAFQNFQGVFKDVNLATSNAQIIDSSGAGSSLQFDFIDCTTFPDSAISADKGNYEQLKSISYTLADSNGAGLTDVKVGVYDNVGLVQGGVQSSTSGDLPTINARFFRKDNGQSAVDKFPFDIRARKYGYQYLQIQSTVSEPIKQEIRFPVNNNLSRTLGEASALLGIDIDFVSRTVTMTTDTDTQRLYDYYQYVLGLEENIQYPEEWVKAGELMNVADWDVVVDGAVYTGELVTTGTITLQNGGSITGEYTDQNGTVFPPLQLNIGGIEPGSRLQIFNETTGTETVNEVVIGSTYTEAYSGSAYNLNDTIRIRLVKLGKQEFEARLSVTAAGFSGLAAQEDDAVYLGLGIDGSAVTKFQPDYVDDDVVLTVQTDWEMAELYAWWCFNLTTEAGMREFFGGLTALNEANFVINTAAVDIYLDNTTIASFKQLDNRRLYRDSGDGYPVKAPTTSGYGLDVVWRNLILIAETPTSGLTQEEAVQLSKAATNSGLIPALL